MLFTPGLDGRASTDRLEESTLRWIVTLMVTAPFLFPPKRKKKKKKLDWIFSPGHLSTSRSPIRFSLGPAVWLWD